MSKFTKSVIAGGLAAIVSACGPKPTIPEPANMPVGISAATFNAAARNIQKTGVPQTACGTQGYNAIVSDCPAEACFAQERQGKIALLALYANEAQVSVEMLALEINNNRPVIQNAFEITINNGFSGKSKALSLKLKADSAMKSCDENEMNSIMAEYARPVFKSDAELAKKMLQSLSAGTGARKALPERRIQIPKFEYRPAPAQPEQEAPGLVQEYVKPNDIWSRLKSSTGSTSSDFAGMLDRQKVTSVESELDRSIERLYAAGPGSRGDATERNEATKEWRRALVYRFVETAKMEAFYDVANSGRFRTTMRTPVSELSGMVLHVGNEKSENLHVSVRDEYELRNSYYNELGSNLANRVSEKLEQTDLPKEARTYVLDAALEQQERARVSRRNLDEWVSGNMAVKERLTRKGIYDGHFYTPGTSPDDLKEYSRDKQRRWDSQPRVRGSFRF